MERYVSNALKNLIPIEVRLVTKYTRGFKARFISNLAPLCKSEFSHLFRINSETGLININNRIDLESNDLIKSGGLIEIEIKAFEIGDENSFEIAKVTVSVLDVNDNAPIFNKKAYNFKVSPKSIEGTPLVLSDNDIETIHVYDPDKGINGSFSLNLVQDDDSKTEYRDGVDFEVSPKIALNDANLILKLKNSSNLLKNMGKTEHLKLVARDNGVDGKIVKVDIFIQIENINEHAPQFEKSVFTFHVDENSSFNTTVGLLEAHDQDTFGDFGKITYELLNGQDRFEIDKESGRVHTTSKNPSVELDREAIDTFYMNVEAIDGGGLRTSAQMIIRLNDVNDNAPEFVNNLKIGWIEENSATWLEPVKVQAFDRDIGKNGAVTYEIIEGDCFKEYFIISNQSQTIELKNNLSLDFEQIYYYKQKNSLQIKSLGNQTLNFALNPGEIDINLIVEARDQGIPSLSSKILVKIIVKDINDNRPKFDQPFYTVQILETAQYGHVIQVHAFDLDAPNTANSKVIYSISSGNKEKFSIDSTSGIITINENANLDLDVYGSVYKLKISAQDFESINSKIKLNKSDENYCYIIIEIIDVNNKKPKFTNNLETISIEENAPLGSHLYQMKAYDSDSDSKLRFFLTEGESGIKMVSFDEKGKIDWIDIDPTNGSLIVTGNIDREQVELIHLVIGVEDLNASEGFRPQKSLTKLIINVIDENDNYPLFPELRLTNPELAHGEDPVFELFESFDENSKINSKITQLKVLDLDKDNNITFKIVSMNDPNRAIMIDKYSGEMFVNNLIDYEKNKWINLSILVNDNGKPVAKHSIVNFYGRINDLNDNPPKFIPLEKSEIKINENNDENYFIVQLKATDLDSDIYGPINYKILNFKDTFYIEPIDGKLYTKASLDREKQSFYNLVVEARDNPYGPISNQLTDTMQIKIIVLDENDNSPRCDQDMYSVEIGQNAEANTVLYHVKGVDGDYGLNSNLTFSLISQNDIDSKNELFEIEKFSGKIKTKKKLIGYSGKLSYKVVINDRLGADDSLSGNCPIQISIKDVNIHYPQFIFPNKNNSNFRIKANIITKKILNYTLVPDSKILTIKAEDKDTGINGEIFFYIDQSNKKNLDWKNFKIDSKSGILSLKIPLNLKDQNIYSIDVIVSDNGQPNALKSRLTLTFILTDDSDNTARFNFKKICQLPEFYCDKSQRNIETKIKEDNDPNEASIILNHAFIADVTNSFSGVCYFVLGPDKDLFEIGLNGTLKPKIKLDRETRDVYNLIIKSTEHCDCLLKAEDYRCNFWRRIDILDDPSLLSLKIQVDDLNDNSPIFEKKFYQVGITYDIDFGDIILESSATDKDLNENLIFSIDNTSIITNSNEEAFPFVIEFSETRSNKNFYETKFLVKLAKNFVPRAQNFEKNIYYQFNLSAFDQSGQNSSATIQIILINKQQRVKLVFSRSINQIQAIQTKFKEYISNLTGLRAFIDSVQVHRKENTSSDMSEILMHFVEPKSRMLRLDPSFRNINPEYIVVDSDTILNILDRSKDIDLLKTYKLSLAEKYDNHGQSIFYRYSSRSEQDFGTFFLLSKVSNQTFYTKLIILASFVLLVLCSLAFFIMCFCIRLKYKRKLRAERAMTKAFGFEQRSIAYSDPIGGYLNHAFDSNSLLPIPGTNLYAYEGSNPVWMNKYDKIGCSNNQSSAASSSSSTSSDTSRVTSFGNSQYGSKNVNCDDNAKNQDISSFYLKQIDSPSTDFSPVSTSNNSDKNAAKNETMSSDVFSNMSPNYDPPKETQNLSSFKVENNLLTFAGGQKSDFNPKPEVFSFKEQIKLLSSQRIKFSNGDETNAAAKNEKVLYPKTVSSFTKIFDNSQSNSEKINTTDDSIDTTNQSKDLSDMFAVESTVI
ncbi:cadherin-23 [Brachionus plicatilis]|uniref:Cadherin-23 n=1 Tax=Brachionus plicatilis TaxID=10195 RepID=A0A3M7PN94_BRAPC|nr:cadherin-23 [Brachionus plicatilis]